MLVMQTKNLIIKIINCFETGSPETVYNQIFIYADGTQDRRQCTLSRGYTECGGSLWMVFQKYKELTDNDIVADKLLEYKKQSCKGTLPDNKDFIKLIHEACDDPLFREAQDYVYDKVYWNKGEEWFHNHGFTLPLSLAVIQDSYLQSGGILDFLRNRFNEKTPSDGGDEKKWISEYIDTRHNWLRDHSRKVLNNTVYRTNFFKTQIKNDNWDLSKSPIFVNGVKITL
jgi:chitosanase